MKVLKISSQSNVNSVAGAIVGALSELENEKGKVELQAVGAGAVNQAVKAIAIARGFVAPSGKELICIPAFTTIKIENEDRSAMKFIVKEIN